MENDIKVNLDIPFATPRFAKIAYDVLRVDKELKKVSKELSLNDSVLHVTYSAPMNSHIRGAINSFFENLILVFETVEQFSDA